MGRPGESRYARLEREQRWLLPDVPTGAAGMARIRDRYLAGTRLRLRRIESEASDARPVYKLGQKIRVADDNPERVNITNLYLSEDEYVQLLALPGAEVAKCRRWLDWHDHRLAIDEFEGRHHGLVLAEVELAADEEPLPRPPFAVRDVTQDDRYSGGTLAWADDDALASIIAIATPAAGGNTT